MDKKKPLKDPATEAAWDALGIGTLPDDDPFYTRGPSVILRPHINRSSQPDPTPDALEHHHPKAPQDSLEKDPESRAAADEYLKALEAGDDEKAKKILGKHILGLH